MIQNVKGIKSVELLPEVRLPEDIKFLDIISTLDALKILKSALNNDQKNLVISDEMTGARVTIGEILDEILNRNMD